MVPTLPLASPHPLTMTFPSSICQRRGDDAELISVTTSSRPSAPKCTSARRNGTWPRHHADRGEPDDPSLPTRPSRSARIYQGAGGCPVGAAPDFRFVDDGRGYRRVVASPRPRRIVESESILNLLDNDFIVIACGGGGIPVIRDPDDKGCYVGIPAVIEKDYAAELLGDDCNADELVFLHRRGQRLHGLWRGGRAASRRCDRARDTCPPRCG